MTKNEIKIIQHLNNDRGSNNVDHVLADTLQITEYDTGQAVASLVEKDYIYEDSNTNQRNLGLRAWKITQNGERKINEIKKNMDSEKEEQLKLENPLELFNIYIKSGGSIQIKHGLNANDIKEILLCIENGEQDKFVDGKTIKIDSFDTFQIYDVSKSFNKHDKGKLKNEMNANKLITRFSGLDLLKYQGIEVSHKFEIPKPLKKEKQIKLESTKDSKKKFKMELSHKIGLGGLIVATTVLLFGNNILGRLSTNNYTATKDSASTFIKDSILFSTTKVGSPNINPVMSKSNNLPILTIPLQNFSQKDSILGYIRNEKKLRPLTILESGQSINTLPNNSYSYIYSAYLHIDSKSETYKNIFKFNVDRFNNYPNLMYEVLKISNDEIYLVGFISQESASKISNIKDNFVLAEKPININDNIALIPLNQIINSSDRTIQIDKENEMRILDIKIK